MIHGQEHVATRVREAGIAGAGGAGFPAYAKWGPSRLVVNHQESEPGYFMDQWLGKAKAKELASLFDALLEQGVLDLVVVAPKHKDRDDCLILETRTGGDVREPDELPIEPDDHDGVVFTYTQDRYAFGKEKALLAIAAGTTIGDDLPLDHDWLVHNTETLWNVYQALEHGEPVTRKLVHVYGDVPEHRLLDVPIGTPLGPLLEAAGTSLDGIDLEDEVLTDGGPGWNFEITDPDGFGVRKRTNAVLVLDRDTVDEIRQGGPEARIDVLNNSDYAWDVDDPETEPTRLSVDRVRVPLISNPSFAGLVAPSRPIVEPGQRVARTRTVAEHDPKGSFSEIQHAPFDGIVTEVVDEGAQGYVEIARA